MYETTGSMPVLVLCDDLEDWVCKYGDYGKLFNEWLASNFLHLWNIPTPPFSIVNILPSHIAPRFQSNRTYPSLFQSPCFGSKHLAYAQDISELFKLLAENNYEKRKILNIGDYFKIALFDLWIANEDRNSNNPNLLLNPTQDGNIITAIDHTEIFNTNNLKMGLAELTLQDSILMADYTKLLIGNQRKALEVVEILQKDYYLCIERCGKSLENIIEAAPSEWGINKQKIAEQINNAIIVNDTWNKKCFSNFTQYLEQSVS